MRVTVHLQQCTKDLANTHGQCDRVLLEGYDEIRLGQMGNGGLFIGGDRMHARGHDQLECHNTGSELNAQKQFRHGTSQRSALKIPGVQMN